MEITLSAVQQYAFCPRQCALIHLEQIWQENSHTALGRLMHETAHGGSHRMRDGVKVVTDLEVRSVRLGLHGRADVVEFLRGEAGRPSLALDLMEEFRPYLADRLSLTLINRRQITGADFLRTEVGGVVLKDRARREVLVAWQERKREEVEHPFLKERMSVGMLCHMQARLLARYIRGDMDAYPPFAMR